MIQNPFIREKRKTLCRLVMTVLFAPHMLALPCLIIAALVNTRPIVPGTAEYYIGMTVFTYLVLCVLVLPSYSFACVWYWLRMRGDPDNGERLYKQLWWLPPITALFMWWPFAFIPKVQQYGFQAFMFLALSVLVIAFLWVLLIRLVLRKKWGF